MHLTSLGKIENSVTALTTLIQNGQKGNLLLANSIKLLSTEEKIAVVSRLALTEQQKIGLLATAGLTKEELKNVVSTGALQVAQDGATGSTFSLTAALQGLKTAVLTNPLLMATAVVAGLFTVYKVVDLLTVSFEEQKENT